MYWLRISLGQKSECFYFFFDKGSSQTPRMFYPQGINGFVFKLPGDYTRGLPMV